MELKNYQKKVIADIKLYLKCLNETKNSETAYDLFWKEKGFVIGNGGVPPYRTTIKNVPRVCLKVPTGGGKTLIAATAIKHIIDSMPQNKKKFVVWLVPTDAILTQTTANLQNPKHPYHQKIAADFGGNFAVYSKEDLLYGQNFNITTASTQLNIAVLSYASLRITLDKINSKTSDTTQTANRNLYKENGNYMNFPKTYEMPESLIDGIDETAVIQIINQQNPIVIVDESHHTKSNLSIEMLTNLNPSFILDLTATPIDKNNIISYVSAKELKAEQMIKIPVIVYNRQKREDVLFNAIDLRKTLERFAKEEKKNTKRYVRPIVLFQAEPKIAEDVTTFQKLKENLINAGINEDEIAIKTADIDELKHVNLLSPTCPIRYIITINAINEGWDCPFAYVLATLANRSSKIAVEQIVGRILRQPGTRLFQNEYLNMSYIFTSSNKFQETVDAILEGLKKSGYSEKDYRLVQEQEGTGQIVGQQALDLPEPCNDENLFEFDVHTLKERLEANTTKIEPNENGDLDIPKNSPLFEILKIAKDEGSNYNTTVGTTDCISEVETTNNMKPNLVNEKYRIDIENIRIPELYIKQKSGLFTQDEYVRLTKEQLSKGFTLNDKPCSISFDDIDTEIGRFDISDEDSNTPKYMRLTKEQQNQFKQTFIETPRESQIREIQKSIGTILNKKFNEIDSRELKNYVSRIAQQMDSNQLSAIHANPYEYTRKIEEYINKLLKDHREQAFKNNISSGNIISQKSYKLPENCRISSAYSGALTKALYHKEGSMNDFERRVITEVTSMDSVEWWHRNPDNTNQGGFSINGFINHFPDFIIKTKEGKIILLETKGDHLENEDSAKKANLGSTWQKLAGPNYLYFMVYETVTQKIDSVYSYTEFIKQMQDIS